MSIKSKLLAGAATLALVGGVGTAGRALGRCGHPVVLVTTASTSSAVRSGPTTTPNFVMDVLRQGAKVGQPIILFRTSNTDPAEDFVPSIQGTTADFYAAGLVSSAVALHYGCIHGGNFPNCVPAALTTRRSSSSTRRSAWTAACAWASPPPRWPTRASPSQPCGVSSKTVWILDINDSPATLVHGYVPLINGSDTNFSHPFVLTYPGNGFPTDKPRPQLFVNNLTGFSNGIGTPIGSVDDTQLWGADTGVLR